MTLPLRLWQPEALHEAEQSFLVVQGFYLGIAILLAGAASILSIYLKQAIFLVFAGNVTSHAMLWLIINGVGPGYLWPGLARSGEIPSHGFRSEEPTSDLQSLMRISSAVFCLK